MSALAGFDELRVLVGQSAPGPFVAVEPHSADAMSAVGAALAAGSPRGFVVGDTSKVHGAARLAGVDPASFELIDATGTGESVARAVDLVRAGRASFIVKGNVATAALLRGLLGASALGSGRLASHIYVLEAPAFGCESIAISDAGVNVAPDLHMKATIVVNACEALRRLGLNRPRVAALSAVEVATPTVPSSQDAAALGVMAGSGELGDIDLDGPLSLDAALVPRAARSKGVEGLVAGRADLLLAPNLDTANTVSKALIGGAGRAMGVVVGAAVPIALPSRGDTVESRIGSLFLAAFLATASCDARDSTMSTM